MSDKKVSVRLVAEGGRQVRAEFEGIGDSGEREFGRIGRAADSTGAVLKRVLGILAAAVSVRELVSYADTWTDLRSRVDLATRSQEAGAEVMQRLAEMARRTYSSLEQTTETYLANATALRELGLTTAESLDFTEALNNALVVSGARAERAASVQNALSKAMALGKLSGDDLNTVIATGGRVAELLAAEMGVTVNALRGLGSEGAITGDVIRRALVGNLELLREQADGMPATIGDAFTLLRNATLTLVGTWDQTAQASATVAQGIIFMADNLDRLAIYVTLVASAFGVKLVAGLLATRAAAAGVTVSMYLLRNAIAATGIGLLVVAAGELVYQFSQLVSAAGGFGEALDLLNNVAQEVWERIGYGAGAVELKIKSVAWAMSAAWADAVLAMADTWNDFVGGIAGGLQMIPGMSGIGVLLSGTRVNPEATTARRELAETNAGRYAAGSELLVGAATAPLTSLTALRDAAAAADTATDGAADATERLNDALANAAGGAAGGAAAAIDGVAESAEKAREAIEKMLDEYNKRAEAGVKSVSDMLSGVILEGRKAADVVGDLLKQLAEVQLQRAVFGLFQGGVGGGFFSTLGGLLTPPTLSTGAGVPAFDGGGYTGMAPRTGGLDGKGGFMAMLHPNETVIDHTKGGRGGASGGMVEVVVGVDQSGNITAQIERTAGAVVARARSGIVQESVAATYAANAEVPLR